MGYPKALAFDAQGNLYIADFAPARVRKVTPDGIITTVAGNGVNGFSGDGGLATSAQLSSPTGLAGHSDSKKVGVVDARAGIFTTSSFGAGQAAAANADGTLNSPDNPAERGKLIALYATGLGQTNPPGIDGLMVKGLLKTTAIVMVSIGGHDAKVVFAGDAPEFVGLSQINAIVPQEVPLGFGVPVSVVAGGNSSAQMVTIAAK